MMHVEVSQAGSGPFLLLAHGICSSRAQWRPNLADLQTFCRPVVVELLGHGRSEAPAEAAPWRVEAYIERFEAIREGLGAERWAICGQSFGAGLTLSYALTHPDRIAGQVFTNSNSALAAHSTEVSEETRLARLDAFERRGREGLEAMAFYPKPTGRLAPDVEAELIADAAHITPFAIAQSLRWTLPGLSVVDRVAETRVPTLLVNGAREKAFQPHRDLAATLVPGIEVVDLDGGHPVNLDRPAEFTAAVRGFLRRL